MELFPRIPCCLWFCIRVGYKRILDWMLGAEVKGWPLPSEGHCREHLVALTLLLAPFLSQGCRWAPSSSRSPQTSSPASPGPRAGVCTPLWKGTPDSSASHHILKVSAMKDRHIFWLCCGVQFVLVSPRSSPQGSLHPWSLPPHAWLFFPTSIPATL